MSTFERPADDLLDIARAVLLVQGGILLAATIEAAIWGAIFRSAGAPVVLSGAAAAVILIGRRRLRAERRWARRLIYAVETVTLALFGIDTALAVALTHALPPLLVLLTQLALPVAVITLLRRATRAAPAARSRGDTALVVAT